MRKYKNARLHQVSDERRGHSVLGTPRLAAFQVDAETRSDGTAAAKIHGHPLSDRSSDRRPTLGPGQPQKKLRIPSLLCTIRRVTSFTPYMGRGGHRARCAFAWDRRLSRQNQEKRRDQRSASTAFSSIGSITQRDFRRRIGTNGDAENVCPPDAKALVGGGRRRDRVLRLGR